MTDVLEYDTVRMKHRKRDINRKNHRDCNSNECWIPHTTFRYPAKIYKKPNYFKNSVFRKVYFFKETPSVVYSLICVVFRQIGIDNFTEP